MVQTSAAQLGALAIVYREMPVPGDGEVLVQMSAAALNHRDLAYLREDYAGGKGVRFNSPSELNLTPFPPARWTGCRGTAQATRNVKFVQRQFCRHFAH